MVSIEEARSQIDIARSQVEVQKQNIIRQTEITPPTALELRQRGRTQLIQSQERTRQLGQARTQALATLDPITKQINEASRRLNILSQQKEQQESAARKRESDFKQAVKIFRSKQGDPFAPPSIKAFVRELERGRELQLKAQIDKAVREIEAKGLKAIPFFEETPNGMEKIGMKNLTFILKVAVVGNIILLITFALGLFLTIFDIFLS